MFDFVFGGLSTGPSDFLEYDFIRGKGFFGYRHLFVIKEDDEVVACLTLYQSKKAKSLSFFSLLSIFKAYSLREIFTVAKRCFVLKSVFKMPSKDSVYMANGYVDPAKRRPGYFSELVAYAEKIAHSFKASAIECDINVDNEVSLAVHRFLGFEEVSEQKVKIQNSLIKNVYRMRYCLRGPNE